MNDNHTLINNVPLLDLQVQHAAVEDELKRAIEGVFESQKFIMGDQVAEFETEIARYFNCRYAVGLASGTDALTLSLRALNIGPGDEVIVPAFSFFATVESVLHVGATPVFADVREDTCCLNVDAIEPLITGNTKAIIPVHLFGHPADMSGIQALAKRYQLKIIEDNAQAFGARFESALTGSISDVGCLSFFPSKNLGAYGDGGMIVTNDDSIAETVRMLRMHGWKRKNFPEMIGYNSRLDTLQAAILNTKLPNVDDWNESRRNAAAYYNSALKEKLQSLPQELPAAHHVYNLYVIRIADRPALQALFKSRDIGNAVYYPAALHELEPCLEYTNKAQRFPVAERLAREVLAIPMFPGITRAQQDYVISALSEFCASSF